LKSALITGATGFIGSALTRKLLGDGWQVKAAVRTYNQALASQGGISQVMVGGIDDRTQWDEALAGVDTVVHLAARVHVMKEQALDPLAEFRQVNVAGTENLLRSSLRCGVERFVFLSSVGVNGSNSHGSPFKEEDVPSPHNYYAQSKLEAEKRVEAIGREHGLKYVIIRAPLVYGPGNPGNFLRFLKILKTGLPLPFLLVTNKRSYLYVENLAHLVSEVMENPAADDQLFFASDLEDVSTAELVRKLRRKLGMRPLLMPLPASLLRFAGRVTRQEHAVEQLTGSLQVDCGKLVSRLGWTPPFSMDHGLGETACWYMKQSRAQ